LIEFEREITVTSNPLLVVRIHDRFGRRTNGEGLFEVRIARLGDPSDFRCESLDMVLFLFEDAFRHEHGEVSVINA